MVMTKAFYLLQYIVFPVALFLTLKSTLTDMTVADCNYGIQAACEELKNETN